MRKPFGVILFLSILLTVLYFMQENQPGYINPNEQRHDYIVTGIVFILLFFSAFSLIYIYFKKSK